MKPFFILLFVLTFVFAACAPAPAPVPVLGKPVVIATQIPLPIPAEKLPVIAIQSPTPPPHRSSVRITTLQLHGGRVSWLGSNNLLAFDETGKDGYDDIFTANLDGSNKVCLTCGKKGLPQKHNGNPSWNPSGDYIVFQSQDPELKFSGKALGEFMASPGQGFNNNIWITTANGMQFWQMTHINPMGGVLHPYFSSDGKKLVWSEMVASGGIGQWVLKIADFGIYKGQPQLSNILTLSPWSLQWYETHSFSPDQALILFSGLPQGKWYFDSELYTYNLLSKVTMRLTDNNDWDQHAQYSPDGKWIAWISTAGISQPNTPSSLEAMLARPVRTEVWLMRADGSSKQRLTHFNDSTALEGSHAPVGVTCGNLAWGPDSRSFALQVQIGRNQSIDLVEFDPSSLEQ
jgi:Tol biopolymer transport system component